MPWPFSLPGIRMALPPVASPGPTRPSLLGDGEPAGLGVAHADQAGQPGSTLTTRRPLVNGTELLKRLRTRRGPRSAVQAVRGSESSAWPKAAHAGGQYSPGSDVAGRSLRSHPNAPMRAEAPAPHDAQMSRRAPRARAKWGGQERGTGMGAELSGMPVCGRRVPEITLA